MRNYSILLFCLIFNNSPGQNPGWIQLPDSNATWCAQRGFLMTGNPDAFHTFNYIQTISDDTLINGLVYHKIYESGILDVMTIPPISWTYTYYHNVYVGCIRGNNNRQAFRIPSSYTVEHLLYDFNLQVGDTVPSSPSIIVSGIDSIFDGANYRLRFKLSSADTSFWPDFGYYEHVSWIEGIGSTGGNFFSLGPYFEHGGSLFEFTHNGTLFYQDSISSCNLSLNYTEFPIKTSISIFPNPVLDKLNIDIDLHSSERLSISVTDLAGKLIFNSQLKKGKNVCNLENLESGIYIYKLCEGKSIIDSGKLLKQ